MDEKGDDLSNEERERILRNYDRAIQLKKGRVISDDRPYVYTSVSKSKSSHKKLIAEPGGFIPEDDDYLDSLNPTKYFEKDEEFVDNSQLKRKSHKQRLIALDGTKSSTTSLSQSSDLVPIPPDVDKRTCDQCNRSFEDSFLWSNFDVLVCDSCRDPKGIHKLITKSTAKERYLLNDVDLDVREPLLKYVLKRNPHNSLWGDMRLYLEAQIADRSLEIWGSEEAVEEEVERRSKQMEQTKLKNYKKKLKELTLQTRSSLYMETHKNHIHTFGEEHYDCKTDMYYRYCTECNYKSTFEKL